MNAYPGSFPHPAHPEHKSAPTMDLGTEPPINLSGEDHPSTDRRGVSLRWLAACTLVGSCGAALLGGAIYISVQGDTSFAERPERATPAETIGSSASTRKGDKLVAEKPTASARQVVRAPMSQRSGDRETVKVRPFIRLAASLSLTSGVYATDIPPFNPLKLFAEGAPTGERYAENGTDLPDVDLSIVKRDLLGLQLEETTVGLSDSEVVAQMEEERNNIAAAGRRAPLAIPPQLMLSRTLRTTDEKNLGPLAYAPATDTRFSGIEVRVVPENVTLAPKTPLAATREPTIEERTLVIKRGESIEQVLRTATATPEQIRSIITALGGRAKVNALPEGQVLQVMLAPGPRAGDAKQVVRVSLLVEGVIDQMAAITDRGNFVGVAPPRSEEQPKKAKAASDEDDESEESESEGTGARLYESLYETALKHDMPRALIDDMVRIFSYDLDFQRRVSGGDNLQVIYTDEDEGEGSKTEVLAATLSVGGEVRTVYRFHAPDDGLIDYFDENGQSLKKFLLRKPVVNAEMRSGFGMRFHPILRYSKMHTGVDWANGRIGEPILASGNGTVVSAGWDSGYGRRVEIQHANGYVTTYSHMSNFGRNIQPGTKVRQGQIIGYIGSSGLSTGPHLHYEVMVNGNFVNPMKIKVPRGRELEGRVLAEFKRQRDEIDGLIVKAGGTKVAQQRP